MQRLTKQKINEIKKLHREGDKKTALATPLANKDNYKEMIFSLIDQGILKVVKA